LRKKTFFWEGYQTNDNTRVVNRIETAVVFRKSNQDLEDFKCDDFKTKYFDYETNLIAC